MRAIGAVALILFGMIGTIARAADLGPSDDYTYSLDRRAAPPDLVYGDPGVPMRSYWLPPWRGLHYFPSTGEMPKVGRLEHLSNEKAPPAESYYRFWSSSSDLETPEQTQPSQFNVEIETLPPRKKPHHK